MDRCDVCNDFIDLDKFLALLPSEVIENPSYWKTVFCRQWAYIIPLFSEDMGFITSLVRKQIQYRTAWLVCPRCAEEFMFDETEALTRTADFMEKPSLEFPAANEDLVINAAFSAIKELKTAV